MVYWPEADMLRFPLLSGLILLASLGSQPLLAQTTADAPAVIAALTGAATVERADGAVAAATNLPVVPGDRLRTGSGRLELLLPRGDRLYLDPDASLDLLSDTLFRLWSGRVILIATGNETAGIRVDTPAATIRTSEAGEYRILAAPDPGPTVVSVVLGLATVSTGRMSVEVRPGASATVAAGEVTTGWFNAASSDPLSRWAEERRSVHAAGASVDYLPPDLAHYSGTFDRFGTWAILPGHGAVWTPRAVAGWRPYWNGRWESVPRVGLTWVGADPWAWPTHHFGRWLESRGRWHWKPEKGWRGAWVQWAHAPGFVGWRPLAPERFPITQLPSPGAPDLYRGHRDDPFAGWTVMPQGAFERSRDVPGHVVRPEWLSRDVRSRFAPRESMRIPPRAPTGPVPATRAPGAGRASAGPARRPGDRVWSSGAAPGSTAGGGSVPGPSLLRPAFPTPHPADPPPRAAFGRPVLGPATSGAGLPPLPGVLQPRASGLPAPVPSITPMLPAGPQGLRPFSFPGPLRGPVVGGFPAVPPMPGVPGPGAAGGPGSPSGSAKGR